ncbi:MAG: endonuclease/exonuclease/phosphatase family protein [Saprospiraceae bacterium]|nr:endonuclease/exonuclease/phosphatase family protein [Saprospiraceae bacterium]
MVKFIRKLNLWVILFTLLAYIAPYISPTQMSFLMFVGVAFPWLLVINIVFFLLWALSRLRYWWYSAVVILLGWSHITSIFGVHFGANTEGAANRQKIRVLSYNICGGISPNTKNKIFGRLALSQFLEKQNADVLCVQEFVLQWGEQWHKQMLDDIPFLKTYPYWIRLEGNDLAIFSRFPIQNAGTLINRKKSNGCTYADILLNEQTIRFYSVQLQSNIVSDIADDLVKKQDIIDDDSWFSVGRMLTRFRRAGIVRAKDSELLKKHMNESPYPIVVCGDFNDIPVSYTYNVLAEGLTDNFQQTGKGFGTTYAGHIPALRIDYILMSPKLTPLSCAILREPHSDHYPVVSDILIN